MPRFIVAPRAREDIKKIGRYTHKKWGIKQRDKYLLGLEQRFQWLADNPKIGSNRDEIKEGYHSFLYEKHTVFYTIATNGDVNIIGIIGPGQSSNKYFN